MILFMLLVVIPLISGFESTTPSTVTTAYQQPASTQQKSWWISSPGEVVVEKNKLRHESVLLSLFHILYIYIYSIYHSLLFIVMSLF